MSETTECPTCAGTGAIVTWDPDSGLIPPSIPFEYATYTYVRDQARERVIAAARLLRDEIAAYQSKPYYSHRYAMLCDAIDTLDRLSEPKP